MSTESATARGGDSSTPSSTPARTTPRISRLSSITARWVALALVLVGGTALTVGTLSYTRARAALITTADARLELLGRDIAQALHRTLMDHAADITTWARLETTLALTFGDVDKELAGFMQETIRADETYVALIGLDRTGRPIVSVGDARALRAGAVPPPRTRLTLVATGDADRPELLRVDTPVFHPHRPDERIGSFVALLDPERLLRRISADRIQRDGTTVAMRASGRALATIGAAVHEPSDAILEKVVHVPPFRDLDAPALEIVARQPAAMALASVYALRSTLIRIGLLVVLLSGIVGGVFAWRLSMPIRRLTASVEHIAARGQLEPITGLPRARGEVGVLTEAFDSMMQRLAVAQREVIAQSRLALLGEIAASIVHDVRTPLSVLKTSAQLLGSPDLSPTEQRDLAEMVAQEVDRLNGVVTNLADLGRPQTRTHTLQALAPLVERTVSVLRPWARAREVTIEASGDPELRVRVDTDQLRQALLNVVHNGAQAAPRGGRVTVRWHADSRAVVIETTDTGPGFSAEARERAFSPFFTTKPDGTGLGLAIVKRIVEAHAGEVGIRNGDPDGACVWIRLPRAD